LGFAKVRYNTGEDIFRIRIENTHGSKIEDWVFMCKDFPKWVNIIARRYGFKISKEKTDLDWAK
jgi:hypothetical protein